MVVVILYLLTYFRPRRKMLCLLDRQRYGCRSRRSIAGASNSLQPHLGDIKSRMKSRIKQDTCSNRFLIIKCTSHWCMDILPDNAVPPETLFCLFFLLVELPIRLTRWNQGQNGESIMLPSTKSYKFSGNLGNFLTFSSRDTLWWITFPWNLFVTLVWVI